MSGEHLTIGELADRTAVATSALRHWEQLGLLPAPARVSGQRRYPRSAVDLVSVILVLKDVGFTLREMRMLTAGPSSAADWRESAHRKLASWTDGSNMPVRRAPPSQRRPRRLSSQR